MIHGLTHEQMYPVKYVGIPKWMCPGPTARQLSPLAKLLREIAQKKKEENQRNYRNEQFDLLAHAERDMADTCAGFAFAGIPIEKLSRKTLNVLMKVAILKCNGYLKDLRGDRIEFLDMELESND